MITLDKYAIAGFLRIHPIMSMSNTKDGMKIDNGYLPIHRLRWKYLN